MSQSTRSAIYRALRFVVVMLLVAFVLYLPSLGGGFLSGKYRRGEEPAVG